MTLDFMLLFYIHLYKLFFTNLYDIEPQGRKESTSHRDPSSNKDIAIIYKRRLRLSFIIIVWAFESNTTSSFWLEILKLALHYNLIKRALYNDAILHFRSSVGFQRKWIDSSSTDVSTDQRNERQNPTNASKEFSLYTNTH